MAFLRTVCGLLTALVLTGFALANSQPASVIYSPVHDPLEVPLYLVAGSCLGGGFVLGGLLVWINNAHRRRTTRRQRRSLHLPAGAAQARQNPGGHEPHGAELFPVLPAQENSAIK